MYGVVSKLILYRDLGKDSILDQLALIFRDWEKGSVAEEELRSRVFAQVKRLLDLSTAYGFDENLWQNYLTFLLITNENSFSLCCERVGAQDGSVNAFAKQDFKLFYTLFHYDFSPLEEALGINCFRLLTSYQAITKSERLYDKRVSELVKAQSRALAAANDEEEFFEILTTHFRDVGVGLFGMHPAFRIQEEDGGQRFLPIQNAGGILLSDLVGYELQKAQLRANTEAFLDGHGANNVLLYGDSGTGKSSSVKALITEYQHRGLRMIELYKHQFQSLSSVIAQIKKRNYRFIIIIDDLSFEENEVEYKFLKAVIEGGVETMPENVLIYATSNRRHLIRETWKDRADMEHTGDIHRSDTVEEKLSLSSRFGLQISYSTPNREQFKRMVSELARRQGLSIEEDALYAEANRWEIRHGGVSGRTAQQFVNHLAGRQ